MRQTYCASKTQHYILWLSPVIPLFPFALASNQPTVRHSAFFCLSEQVSVFAFTLWGLFAEGLRHTPKFLTHLPHHLAKLCSMFRDRWTGRQTHRQTGTRRPRPNIHPSEAWRLWSDTAIRSGALAPPARLERRRLKVLSVWETGPSMSKPFIALASYCFSLLGGYYESTPSKGSGMGSSFISHNLGN